MLKWAHVLAVPLAVLTFGLAAPGSAAAAPDADELDEPVPGLDEPIPSPSPSPPAAPAGGSDTTIAKAAPVPERVVPGRVQLLRPTLKLGYRTFATPDDDLPRDQPWNVATVTVYPWSNRLRVGLATELGIETAASGRSTADFFIKEGLVVGIAYPGPRLTPFLEATLGGGLMRRLQTQVIAQGPRVVPAYGLLWSLGADAGAEVRMVGGLCASFSLGLLHPTEVRYATVAGTGNATSTVYQSTVVTLTAAVGF